MNTTPYTFLVALSLVIVFAVLRFTLPVQGLDFRDTFKDLAHIFVGWLFGAWWVGRQSYCYFSNPMERARYWLQQKGWGYFWLAITIAVLEVIAAIVRKP